MASVAKVCGAEAEEHGHRATVPALILKQISAVFGTYLCAGHVTASAANQLCGVVVGAPDVQLAPGFTPVVSLRKNEISQDSDSQSLFFLNL